MINSQLHDPVGEHGYPAMPGQITDATLVAAPRQRTIEGEKQTSRCRRHVQMAISLFQIAIVMLELSLLP